MAVWIGIDEAGYGPRLGPLCLGLYALSGPQQCDIWDEASGITRDVRNWRKSLVVCDSKDLHKSQLGLERLETSALSLIPQSPSFYKWLQVAGDFSVDELSRYPWYREDLSLPLFASPSRIESHHNLLMNHLQSLDLKLGPALVRPVLERRFNSLLKHHNKSTLEFEMVMGLLERALEAIPNEKVFVAIDKLGGRDYYSSLLARHFPMQEIQILSESRLMSHYVLPEIQLDIRFYQKADQTSFLVAAASLLAKYCREVFMHLLNNWWCSRIDGLAPTAGYPQDAARYLEVIEPHLLSSGYSSSWLVREK